MKHVRILTLATAALALASSLAFAAAPAAPASAKATTAAPAKATTAAAPAKAAPAVRNAPALVDLNTASKEQLTKLPGIGEAIAAKIIAGRPWANKSQLLAKGLVNKPAYDKFAALVVAKQAK